MTKPAAEPAVLRPSDRVSHDRGGGCSTVQLVTPACGATQLINGITTFAPGAAIGKHWHNCEESVMVLEGDAVVVIGDVEHQLKAGDTTWLPPYLPHFFRNASQDRPMRIFWTYASARATRTLESTKEERPIAAEHA